jgi:uncharacterized protein (TIGR03435 family)
MTISAFWNESWTAAVVNHLWQSTVVVAIAWLLALALRRNHARIRYWVWFAASVKFLLPFSLLTIAGEWMRSLLPAAAVAQPAVANALDQAAQPFSTGEFFGATAAQVAAHHSSWALLALLAIWACGALIVLGRFARAWRSIHRAKHAARPIDLAADVPVLLSPMRIEPGIFGILRPVLLLPEGILQKLAPEQLSAIVAHEMCHVRRRDNLTFAVHMVVETLFWFHPAVWWIGARLIEERECACDEAVVVAGSEAEVYAEGILSVCKFYVESPMACVSGVTGSNLKRRIVRIMAMRGAFQLTKRKKLLLGAAALIVVAGPLSFGLLNAMQAGASLLHTTGPLPSFEVATIKPSKDSNSGLRILFSRAGNFSTTNATLRDLIRSAYHTKSDDQIIGGPDWVNDKFFDIQAKVSGAESEAINRMPIPKRIEEGQLLVQSLLADRFQLKVSFKTEELPVYALVVAKGGHKVKEVELSPMPTPGSPPQPGSHHSFLALTGPHQVTASAWPMSQMVDWLSRFDEVDNRIVVDETGLKGNYDWVLNGISTSQLGVSAHPPDESVTSIFTALQEQLGLKLVPQKAPVEVLVIDHVEPPSPN